MAIKTKIGTIKHIHGVTARVAIDMPKTHRLYGKPYRDTTSMLAHLESDLEAKVGDVVEIKESRPISKRKSWKVVKVVEVSQ
ncbi:mitochondrial small ribosomal subunit protein uS17m [Candidatus Berkelbacteria bacterium]|nr:mitochondrial small ribosomal subunit protein uS17m [Candidatus Berkelbacteria bacterium]